MMDCDVWFILLCFLYILSLFIDINPHTKFQVATLKSTSHKNLEKVSH